MPEFLTQRNCLGYDGYYLSVKFCILFSDLNLYKNTSFWSPEARRLKSRLKLARMILMIMHGHVTVFPLIETAASIKSSTFKCWHWQLNQRKRKLLLTNYTFLCNEWYCPIECYPFTLKKFSQGNSMCSLGLLLKEGF